MNKLFKWLLPILILANILLAWSGVLSGEAALLVVLTVELLALAVGLRQVIAAILRFRRDRSAGLDVDAALEEGLAVIFPRPVARVVALEPRVWLALYRWLFRRRPLGPDEFGYSKRSVVGSMLVLVLFSAPVEIFLFELLIPWDWLRWLLLIGAIYGAIWFLGYYGSLKVLPYRIGRDGLRVYYGVLADGLIPYRIIAQVEQARRKTERSEGPVAAPSEQAVYITCGNRTDLTLRLHEPIVIQGFIRPMPPATTIHLAADDPQRLAEALSGRLESLRAPDAPASGGSSQSHEALPAQASST